MQEHKERIEDGARAAALLERMVKDGGDKVGVAPIGVAAHNAPAILQADAALRYVEESRRLLEEARSACVAMQAAAARSRESIERARVRVSGAFLGSPVAAALLDELLTTERHLGEIPMPVPSVGAERPSKPASSVDVLPPSNPAFQTRLP